MENNSLKNIKALIVILTTSIMMTYYLYNYLEISENELFWIFVLLFGFIVNHIYSSLKLMNKKYVLCSFFVSLFISFSLYIGKQSWIVGEDSFLSKHNVIVVLSGIPFIYMLLIYIGYVWKNFRIPDMESGINFKKSNSCNGNWWKVGVLPIILFLSWIPALIYNYPGIIISDYNWQYSQALGVNELSNHHPVIHTMLIKISQFICKIVTGSVLPEISVFINSLMQMLIMAILIGIVLYNIFRNAKSKVMKIMAIVITIWYAIFPMYGLFSVYMTKDVIFSLLIFVWTFVIYQGYDKNCNVKKWEILVNILLITLIIWFRGNGFLVVIGTLCVIAVLLDKRIYVKVMLLFSIVVFLGQSPILNSFNIKKTELVESIGMPINQIANVVKKDEALTDEEKRLISNVMPLEMIKENYNIRYSDHLKFNSNFKSEIIEKNKEKYLELYCKLLLKYPKDFIEAGLNLTIGYWYPGVDKGIISYDYDSRYQLYEDIGISKYYKGNMYKHFLTNDVRENKIESVLWSPGAMIMVMFVLMLLCIAQKSYRLLFSFVPTLFCWGSLLIATPSYLESRYVFYIFLNIPIWLFAIVSEKEKSVI